MKHAFPTNFSSTFIVGGKSLGPHALLRICRVIRQLVDANHPGALPGVPEYDLRKIREHYIERLQTSDRYDLVVLRSNISMYEDRRDADEKANGNFVYAVATGIPVCYSLS